MDDDLDRLARLMPPPPRPAEPPRPEHWEHVERHLGTRLPDDFRTLVTTYGTGGVDEFLAIFNPAAAGAHRMDRASDQLLDGVRYIRSFEALPFPIYPEPAGLLPWGTTSNGDALYWVTDPEDDPDRWQIAISEVRGPGWVTHPGPVRRFVTELLDGSYRVPFFPDDFPSTDAAWTPFRPLHEPVDPRSWDRAEEIARSPRRHGDLRSLLESLADEHARVGSPLRSHLRPGMADEVVEAAVRSIGVTVGQELVELYGWSNGTLPPGGADVQGAWLVPQLGLLAIEDAVDLHGTLAPVLASRSGVVQTHPWLRGRDWLPLMRSSSTIVGMICSGEDAGELRSILEHRSGPGPDATTWTEIWTPYLELASATEDFVERLRAGVHSWDSAAGAWIDNPAALEEYRAARF